MQDTGKKETGGDGSSSASTQTKNDPLEDEDIPIYQEGTETMAMFVPLEHSLFEPFEPPRDKVDRLKVSLETFEKHSAAVSANLEFVYERERRRIIRHAQGLEATDGVVETNAGLEPRDEELMMAYVEAPMPPGADYNNRHLSTYRPPSPPQVCPPRQAAIRWSLFNAGQALQQVTGYAAHAQTIKDSYQASIQREQNSAGGQAANREEGKDARN
ncbi:uncharacterized protein CTRU02_203776 [Colletotrichum truncatum]|uniref:Uncharacterized protein n=1 Tax=Colletotrichum truncatum TaxID=5467 RepID=A0ACC3ZAW8_COLTU|nr:uncharacterized protein CTRU02_04107 [Colletotrichum truncatum]KAF6796146.1 hypothetical protein CTRU02_04107 [Colletotrichum truncatum]